MSVSILILFLSHCTPTNSIPAVPKAVPAAKPAPATKPAPVAQQPGENLTDAEKVSRLQRGMDADRKEIEALMQQMDDPESEYQKGLMEFQKLETRLEEQKKALEQAKQKGDKTCATELEKSLPELQKQWQLAKDRSNLLLEERKTVQQKIAALNDKIQQDQKALDQLTGKPAPAPMTKPTQEPTATPPNEAAKPEASAPPKADTAPPPTPPAPAEEPTPPKAPAIPIIGELTKKNKPGSAELSSAKKEAQTRKAEADKARAKVDSITQRINTLQRNVELEQKLLNTSRQKVDNVNKTLSLLREEQSKLYDQGKSDLEVWKKMQLELARAEEAQGEVRKSTNRLTALQAELTSWQSSQITALNEANQKKLEANAAQEKVAELQNPYTWKNVLQWLIDRGPVVGAILFAMFVFNWLVRLLSKRILLVHVRSTRRRSKEREVEQRADTLSGVLRNFCAILIWGGGTLMILTVLNVPIGPLMGGAAVFGLAVAFGAQNLIRDYFTGFMLLVEDQYGVKDVVKIGDIAGQVERITLRMTVLRDLEGVLHFIPHGTITRISNMTHSWSRALFDVGIAYRENVDRVIAVLRELGEQMQADPEFGPMITEKLEMLGVNSFDESSVTIRFFIKTRPMKQWQVKRELLRRIKNRFDELGIEIPFPHRTVYHRHEVGDSSHAELGHEAA